MQVNGFAGVDYNDPSSSHEAIAQIYSCDVHNRRDAIFSYGYHRVLKSVWWELFET